MPIALIGPGSTKTRPILGKPPANLPEKDVIVNIENCYYVNKRVHRVNAGPQLVLVKTAGTVSGRPVLSADGRV